ncbi:hypothetical protein EG68_09637 [Paragonimus skrjabini miyazakii]|uniref:Ubiquitin thioesterase n=1 Tax=Paragonimus skrjabini miyazakii TaxID=59628 RepID=A0A8S9YAW8_9TREM|nr:hypothetical protein EG68_09637 [Paragonimus skrjabini miyazakii]
MVTEKTPNNAEYVDVHSDEATQAQQEAIESDIKSSSPLISPILPLTTLDDDFSGHAVYLEKLDILKKKYSGIRRLRRDGNCFYRAFGFAYIEYLSTGKRLKEAARLKSKCDDCRDTLISLGYTQFTVEDFHEQFTAMVDRFTIEEGSLEELEETFNNQAFSDYYVVFLRLLVSAYMQKNATFYADFIDEGRTINQFCETEVEPMARESDNIHVAALALAVGLPIGIENCQQSGELTRIEFPAQSSDSAGVDGLVGTEAGSPSGEAKMIGIDSRSSPILPRSPPVTLLYRPGHYDILYSN